jgi:putative tricarboxylic transport membrane protein
MLERSLRESLSISQGDFSIFFTRPISLTLLIIMVVILATSCRKALLGTLREESKEAQV